MTKNGTAGTCYGFEVDPVISFEFVRGGSGDPLQVEVTSSSDEENRGALVKEWRIDGPEPFFAGLYERRTGYHLWTADSGSFEIEPNRPRIAIPADGNAAKREERLWGIPALLCFIARGDIPLHAASIDVGGSAILLAAPGQFGKTTMSAGFVCGGHRLLSEDLTCVRLDEDCAVIPGPAMLRIRADVAEHLDVPHAAVLDAGDARLHLALDADTRGDCAPVPVRAVVFLHGGAETIELQRVDPSDVVRNLFALGFRVPGAADVERTFAASADLAARVPTWNLSYPFGLDLLEGVVDTITTRLAR